MIQVESNQLLLLKVLELLAIAGLHSVNVDKLIAADQVIDDVDLQDVALDPLEVGGGGQTAKQAEELDHAPDSQLRRAVPNLAHPHHEVGQVRKQ